jgi:hypothetical protein
MRCPNMVDDPEYEYAKETALKTFKNNIFVSTIHEKVRSFLLSKVKNLNVKMEDAIISTIVRRKNHTFR